MNRIGRVGIVLHESWPADLGPVLRSQMRRWFPVCWIGLAVAVLGGDYVTGPFIQFPIFFVIPVLLAAWYNGSGWGLTLALALPLARLSYAIIFWNIQTTGEEVALNAIIWIIVLGLLAYLAGRVAGQHQALTQEVRALRGLLPICGICKNIRNEEQVWQPLEQYIHEHSEAELHHELCPTCLKAYYGDFYKNI